MKLYFRVISLALAVLLTLPFLGSTGALAESPEEIVSGTVLASSLPDGAAVSLIGDTILILDEPKTITSITGEYSLRLRGSKELAVENAAGDAIFVDSLIVQGSVSAAGEYGLHTSGDITVSGGTLRVESRADGICSENGTVTLDAAVDVSAVRPIRTLPRRSAHI